MANAPHDQNRIKAELGVLCTDGITLVPIAVDAGNGGMMIDTTATISFTPGSIDFRDANYQPCLMAQNSVDGSPIPVFVTASGAVLVAE